MLPKVRIILPQRRRSSLLTMPAVINKRLMAGREHMVSMADISCTIVNCADRKD